MIIIGLMCTMPNQLYLPNPTDDQKVSYLVNFIDINYYLTGATKAIYRAYSKQILVYVLLVMILITVRNKKV